MERKLALFALALLCASPAAADQATLEADHLQFQAPGEAQAIGNVHFDWGNLSLRAEKIFLEQSEQLTLDGAGQQVLFRRGQQLLRFDSGSYNIKSERGKVQNLSFEMPAGVGTAYLKANSAEVMPLGDAVAAHWLKSTNKEKDVLAARLSDLMVTTCPCPEPTYQIGAKRLVVVPNEVTIIKRPTVYLWGHRLFTSPFDISLSTGTEGMPSFPLLPQVKYRRGKGFGLLAEGAFYFPRGYLALRGALWQTARPEVGAQLGYTFTNWLRVKGEMDRDFTAKRKIWRSSLELVGSHKGYNATVRAKFNEKVGRRRNETVRLDRLPEITFSTPWYSWKGEDWQVGIKTRAGWGRYITHTNSKKDEPATRWGLGCTLYSEKNFDLSPNAKLLLVFKGDYQHYWYGNLRYQGTINFTVGGVYSNQSGVRLGLAYQGRRRLGKSPFSWDRTTSGDWLYPLVGFNLTQNWHLDLETKFDVGTKTFRWLEGQAVYDDLCCTRWRFFYRHPLQKGEGRRWGASIEITAFPDQEFAYGSTKMTQPLSKPKGLK